MAEGPISREPGRFYILISSLPYEVDSMKLSLFIEVKSGVIIPPTTISMVRKYDHPARHSGEALVPVVSPVDRIRIVEVLHGKYCPSTIHNKVGRVIQARALTDEEAKEKFRVVSEREERHHRRVQDLQDEGNDPDPRRSIPYQQSKFAGFLVCAENLCFDTTKERLIAELRAHR